MQKGKNSKQKGLKSIIHGLKAFLFGQTSEQKSLKSTQCCTDGHKALLPGIEWT